MIKELDKFGSEQKEKDKRRRGSSIDAENFYTSSPS